MKLIREFIRKILSEAESKDLLTEPDLPEETDAVDREQEASVAAAVPGVTVPLGAGPTHPKKSRKKRKSPADVAGRSFGNAKPIKK